MCLSIKNIISRATVLYVLYSVFAVMLFVWFLFPSEYFADYIEKSVQAHGSGVLVEIETVSPAFPAGIKLSGLKIKTPDVESVPVDYFRAGINIFSLIKLQPVISFSAGLFGGTINGQVKIPDRDIKKSSVDALVVKGIDLSECSALFASQIPGFNISGIIDADGSYASEGRGHGKIDLMVNKLNIQPEKPLFTLKSISFEKITAEVEIKSKRIQIENCEIDGNEFDGNVKGSVIIKSPYNRSVLRLSGKFRPEKEFAEKMPLELVFKKKVKYGDEVPFKISGTIKKPRLR